MRKGKSEERKEKRKGKKRIPLAEKPSPDIMDSLVLLRDNRSYIRKYHYKIH